MRQLEAEDLDRAASQGCVVAVVACLAFWAALLLGGALWLGWL